MSETKAPDPTGKPPDRRKLIAVLHMDMVGYSRLIGLDDVGTLDRLRVLRRDVIDSAIEEHGGRLVNTGGDSLLIVFDSIDGAVRCAVKVQQQVPTYDIDQPPDRAIRFRVGINIGDVIPDGTDVHGDVVNVAARLQAECPPGGICVSRQVRDHVRDRLDLAFEELGTLNLKNIARPVEAFVLRPDVAATAPKSAERSLVQAPSIAVLAFTNMSGDLEQEYFSDGVADDIITELSRSRSLFVIARNSSFTYRGRAVDIKQVAGELGVRYVLEGSVRRSGPRVRVVAQLIDAETGNHIWAERYDRALEDVFAIQDEITTAVVTAIVPAVAEAEVRRVLRKPPENLGAWELYQRGLWYMGKSNRSDNKHAQEYYYRALSLDGTLGRSQAAMAVSLLLEGAYGARPLVDAAAQGRVWAQAAFDNDPTDADAQAILAMAAFLEGNYDDALERTALALASNSNSFWANAVMGALLVFGGRSAEGRAALSRAQRLSPHDLSGAMFPNHVIIAHYFERDYAVAEAGARRVISRYPTYPLAYRWRAAALGQLGRTDEAHGALQTAIAVSPTSFGAYVHRCPAWFRPEDFEHMLDGLRKAGWDG